MANYNIYDTVSIPGRITEVSVTEDGTFYKVKFVANNKSQILLFEEDEITCGTSPTQEQEPETEPTEQEP